MRKLLLSAVVAATFAATSAYADEPKLPKSATTPTVALATAKESDGKVALTIRVVESVLAEERRTVTTYQTISRIVDGKQVTEKVPVQQTIVVKVMKPVRFLEMAVKLGDPDVEVRDLDGKEVPAKKLATLLEKETPILLSTAGPVSPFHLQLAKEGTLVVIAPAPVGAVGRGPVPIPAPVAIPGVVPAAPPVLVPIKPALPSKD